MKYAIICILLVFNAITTSLQGNGYQHDLTTWNRYGHKPGAFLLKDDHPAWHELNELFNTYHPLESVSALKKAGFKTVSLRHETMRVVSHPRLPGYLLKLFPNSEINNASLDMSWAVIRCSNAQKIRELIESHQMQHITVPRKWIYLTPDWIALKEKGVSNYIALVVEDMQLCSPKECITAWANETSEAVIRELYIILSHGYASCKLPDNIPYTKQGTYSCIDTEQARPNRTNMSALKYLSPLMHTYWKKLLAEGLGKE